MGRDEGCVDWRTNRSPALAMQKLLDRVAGIGRAVFVGQVPRNLGGAGRDRRISQQSVEFARCITRAMPRWAACAALLG